MTTSDKARTLVRKAADQAHNPTGYSGNIIAEHLQAARSLATFEYTRDQYSIDALIAKQAVRAIRALYTFHDSLS